MSNILQVLGIGVGIAVGVWSVQEKAQEKAQEKPAETPVAATAAPPAAEAPKPQFDPLKAHKDIEIGNYYLKLGNFDLFLFTLIFVLL